MDGVCKVITGPEYESLFPEVVITNEKRVPYIFHHYIGVLHWDTSSL